MIEDHTTAEVWSSAASGVRERVDGHAPYQTKSWPHARRVIIKGEVTRYPDREARDNPRFVITNIPADPQVVYHRIYAQRGDVENRLKVLHDGIAFDRLSCTRFLANQARLLLYAAAFVLYQELRLAARLPARHQPAPVTKNERNPNPETKNQPPTRHS